MDIEIIERSEGFLEKRCFACQTFGTVYNSWIAGDFHACNPLYSVEAP